MASSSVDQENKRSTSPEGDLVVESGSETDETKKDPSLVPSLRRVKVYTLNPDKSWEDRGTGHVACIYVEELQGVAIEVRNEENGVVLLQSKIQMETMYILQQKTLIVWTEADNNGEFALSFQEMVGCKQLWEKICNIQGKDPFIAELDDLDAPEGNGGVCSEELSDQDDVVQFEEVPKSVAIAALEPLDLPPCELGNLDDIADTFTKCMSTMLLREQLALGVERDNYIRKLIDLFHVCEDLENYEGLYRLFDIFKILFLLNNTALYNELFSDDVILDAVGALEYDPNKTEPIRHRDYLATQANFKEVATITKPEVLAKIHETYRLQYVHDAVLPTPTVFEENVLSALGSRIFFNKTEIVMQLQEDEEFMKDLFGQLNDFSTPIARYRDLLLLVKDLCIYSLSLKIAERLTFLKCLCQKGLVSALCHVLKHCHDRSIELVCLDIVSQIAEFNATVIRDVVVNVAETRVNEDEVFFNVIIDKMIDQKDSENGIQYVGLLKIFIDTDNMITVAERTEKATVVSFFYKHCMHQMVSPLLSTTRGEMPCKDDYSHSVLLGYILELLVLCVEKHTYHIKNYIINHNLLGRALVLLRSRHSHLRLSAVRFCRRLVGLKDDFYNRYLIQQDLMAPVIAVFLKNGSRYNLINSAIIEMFEFISRENIVNMITYIVERHMDSFHGIAYVSTFDQLQLRYEQEQDRKSLLEQKCLERMPSPVHLHRTLRLRRDPRDVDFEEEAWFFNEDDEDEGDLDLPSRLGPDPLAHAAKSTGDSDVKGIGEDDGESGGYWMKTSRGSTSETKGNANVPLLSRFTKKRTLSYVTARSIAPPRSERPASPPLVAKPIRRAAIKFRPIVGLVDYPDEDSDEDNECCGGRPGDSPSKKSKLEI